MYEEGDIRNFAVFINKEEGDYKISFCYATIFFVYLFIGMKY